MTSYAEIKAKLEQEDKKIRKRASYDEHNLQAAEVRYIRGVYPDLEGVFFAVPNGGKRTSRHRRDYETYDYLIAMDHNNLRNMARFVGGDPEHKVSLLMDHTRRPGDVADPWYTGDFEATWQDVLEGCTALLEELR